MRLVVLRLAVLALALGGPAVAVAATQVEFAPTWGGWSRPGRMTEVAVRMHADAATRGAVEIVSGAQTLRAAIELAPGDTRRFEVTVPASAALDSVVELEGAPAERRAIALSLSEAPLLAVGLADGRALTLPGFHVVTVAAADLPHGSAAYASVDAVMLDAATVRILVPRQLVALIGYAAACGRVVLAAPPPDVLRLLEGSAGCGGHMLVSGATPEEALERLGGALANPAASPPSAVDLAGLLRPDVRAWSWVVAGLSAFFGIASLALLLARRTSVLLGVPLFATLAMVFLPFAGEPRTRLTIWAEAAPASRVAQYRGRQEVSDAKRGGPAVPLLANLGHPQACDESRPVRLEVDSARGRPLTASFDRRLFDVVSICYGGQFPVMRAARITVEAGGTVAIHNEGTIAWPPGSFVATGAVQPLPALGPGMSVTLRTDRGRPPQDGAQRTALARTPFGGYGLLWPLALDSVADAPPDSQAWLLVPIEGPT